MIASLSSAPIAARRQSGEPVTMQALANVGRLVPDRFSDRRVAHLLTVMRQKFPTLPALVAKKSVNCRVTATSANAASAQNHNGYRRRLSYFNYMKSWNESSY